MKTKNKKLSYALRKKLSSFWKQNMKPFNREQKSFVMENMKMLTKISPQNSRDIMKKNVLYKM